MHASTVLACRCYTELFGEFSIAYLCNFTKNWLALSNSKLQLLRLVNASIPRKRKKRMCKCAGPQILNDEKRQRSLDLKCSLSPSSCAPADFPIFLPCSTAAVQPEGAGNSEAAITTIRPFLCDRGLLMLKCGTKRTKE